ncbi:MAG: alkaline phosphatase family protein [Verrucomicrobia bacterium]|nr:alkaline phosphatase family protein [Verrucomicrobiota bacterium]
MLFKFGKQTKPKVLVIGLDCAEPSLLFGPWLDHLPNFRQLIQSGAYGKLRSCDPPITVPAWSVMTSSRNPGALGIYGFRNRADYSYDKHTIANSTTVGVDRVWDILSRNGKQVILIGIPQTYPPKPVNGLLVGDFLTPDIKSEYTYPPNLKDEIAKVVGEYIVDVRDFRTDNKPSILRDIFEMTEKRFKLAEHLLRNRPWDFFMMVEIGVDRIHHAFWAYMDKAHRRYEPGNKFENAIFDYYKFVDAQIGSLLKIVDDRTTVFIVSDHGAQRMEGSVCVNEWLIREGYLALLESPTTPTPFAKLKIDWSKTKAWGDGGYYSRVFLNVRGREPQGIVDPADYDKLRSELIPKLEAIPDENGKPIGTKVFRPEELYKSRKGVAPDLLVYFGNLAWRSAGTVGWNSLHIFENDTGPDDANHGQHGIFIARSSVSKQGENLEGLQIQDIAPTILQILKVPIPADMEGTVIAQAVS